MTVEFLSFGIEKYLRRNDLYGVFFAGVWIFQTSMKSTSIRPAYSFFNSSRMGAIILHGMHREAPKSTNRGRGTVVGVEIPTDGTSDAFAVGKNSDDPHAQPESGMRLPLMNTQAIVSRAATKPPFFDGAFILVEIYEIICRISSAEGTLPLTLTTPSTTSAGVIMTPNAMIF